MTDPFKKDSELLKNIQARWSDLAKLLEEINSHWGYEDPIYRFYHQSFKVYALQSETRRIVDALHNIAPAGRTFCPMFQEIYQAGASGKPFESEHNRQWTVHTRPFLEAFFPATFFLEMAVKYGKELSHAPTMLLPVGPHCFVYTTCDKPFILFLQMVQRADRFYRRVASREF